MYSVTNTPQCMSNITPHFYNVAIIIDIPISILDNE